VKGLSNFFRRNDRRVAHGDATTAQGPTQAIDAKVAKAALDAKTSQNVKVARDTKVARGAKVARGGTVPAVFRQARQDELSDVVRMIVPSTGDVDVDLASAVDFVELTGQRGIDLSAAWVMDVGGQVAFGLLPVVAPGRSMSVLLPPVVFVDPRAVVQLIHTVIDHHASRGVLLAQALLDPAQRDVRKMLTRASFNEMAELVYLSVDIKRNPVEPALPEGFAWDCYRQDLRNVFMQTIERSYGDSLDCPELNGVRGADDVLLGHMAAGEFDASMWLLLTEHDIPRGVLLLARTPATDAVELVYVGLIPEARRRGLGKLMLQKALAETSAQHRARLTLAVDARNTPALRLYYRHGMKKVCTKVAMVRVLCAPSITPAA